MSNSDPVSITNRLDESHQLTDSPKIRSSNQQYFAVMQLDGDFVLYKDLGEKKKSRVWSTGTSGKGTGPYHVELQHDGNLVLYDNIGAKLFTTEVKEHGQRPHHLIVENGGHLVIYDAKDEPIWSSASTNTLKAGSSLENGGQIVSTNGTYTARNTNGNFILTKSGGGCLWSSCTSFPGPSSVVTMNTSGSLVIYQKLTSGDTVPLLSWSLPSGSTSYLPYSGDK